MASFRRLLRAGCQAALPLGLVLRPALAPAQPGPADTLRFNALMVQFERASPADTAAQRRYLSQALGLSRRVRYEFGEGAALNALSYVASLRNDTLAHRRLLQQARQLLVPLYRRHHNPRVGQVLAANINNQANDLQVKGDYQGAARAMLDLIAYLRQAGAHELLVVAYYNLGGVFFSLDQFEQAIYYWKQALALQNQVRDAPVLVVAAANIANHYTAHGQFAQARPYLAQAAALSARPPGVQYRDQYLNAQGKYELAQGRPQQGVALLEQALTLARRRGDPSIILAMLPDVAEGHQQLGHYAQTRAYLLECLSLTAAAGDVDQTVELEALAEVEEKLGHPTRALAYFRRFHTLHDSLNSLEVKTRLNDLETRYRTREKEQRITLLQQRQRLQAEELRLQHQLTYGAFALIVALLGAGGLGYAALRNRRQLERQQQQLQAQKIQELEQERQLLATEAMLRGQEEERSRLARDLHDGLGGMLSTVKLYLGSVRGNVVLPEASAQLFARSLEHLDGSISELRRVARDMMPEALLQFGLVPALRDLCQAIDAGAGRRLGSEAGGPRVQFQAYGLEETRLPQRTEVVVYRLVQELLNNVLKHAQASAVLVQLMRDGRHIQLVVEDDGRGFEPTTVRGGVGLRSIQARVDYLRGILDLQSAPGQGTTTTIDFHLTAPEAPALEATVRTAETSSLV
ncbi:sensor histidine kinase [Hymenobacter sp. ASUV-10]|uniref:Sensor histidine kinase n=1 Tax=Hymenobacter aranciens TaxID=3063996 RepID=A0ABT9BH90_9BACT|nr:sensor histidine kinase [Hymenobacter sp. ASUV-10]MDO7876372.1 sensor histidine kinase [Hymenobacter sp. ASUV-10]